MSLFVQYTATEARMALEAGRVVFFVGQRRSGLTHWVRAFSDTISDSSRRRIVVDLAQHSTLERLTAVLAMELQIDRPLRAPSDLLTFAEAARGQDLVFCNLHRLALDGCEWLLRALLDRISGGLPLGMRVGVEGAVDLDDMLGTVFPHGTTSNPLILWSEPTRPWAVMSRVEQYVNSRPRPIPHELVPWIVDYARGDLVMIGEFLERLPRVGTLNSNTIQAAWNHVVERGRSAIEMLTMLREIESTETVARLIAGGSVAGLAPPSIEDPTLRKLYVWGVVGYDPILESYIIASPAVARVLSAVVQSPEPDHSSLESASIHAQTSYLLWQISIVELQLRARLNGVDVRECVKATTTETPWAGKSKLIRKELANRAVAPEVLTTLTEIMTKELPDKVSLLEEVERRLKQKSQGELTDGVLCTGLTFAEIVQVAITTGVVNARARVLLDTVRIGRNSVAHFRGLPFDEGRSVVRAISDLQRVLNEQ